jgi:hypothetical protein
MNNRNRVTSILFSLAVADSPLAEEVLIVDARRERYSLANGERIKGFLHSSSPGLTR